MTTDQTNCPETDRHILIAVDESENAKRTVLYVADFLGCVPRVFVTLLCVIPEPPVDYFKTDQERTAWLEQKKSEAAAMLEIYGRILVQSGFGKDKVEQRVEVSYCPHIADCILNAQQKLRCRTLVIGRRGLSKKEEFLFGSTSSKIVHSARDCAVWVIE